MIMLGCTILHIFKMYLALLANSMCGYGGDGASVVQGPLGRRAAYASRQVAGHNTLSPTTKMQFVTSIPSLF